ncbi:hypothetical protein [Sporosarcina limicola]|uniref:CN hydrolase domain-containing protein n=1 Tax=Sporosarcina limicola TaxID=34101 RepID=A0A927MIW2_9BACL|nr:hypothetical protein [Sporosarcina limicola]MBE1555485.1 hypothetical protein [Sporosarcina limicola]
MEILLVQPYEDYAYNYQELYDKVKEIIQMKEVDLVVFPEAFIPVENDDAGWTTIEYIADFLDKPVLLGFSMADGSERAYYLNWEPKEGETEEKSFIKHSTADTTIFDYELTNEEIKIIYQPILLNGQRIQVYVCHDMFFPLITERLEQEGLDILINLTGGNVKMSKWCNLLKGRSIELQAPVFCTMGNRINMKQPSDRISYYKGKKVKPTYTLGVGEKEHAFSIFSLGTTQQFIQEDEPYYSDKLYHQFTVGINENADCVINLEDLTVSTDLKETNQYEYSYRLLKGNENVHVHIANYEDLLDRTYLYRQPRNQGDHQIIVYLSEEEIDKEVAIALLKLRVIESRVAAVVASPSLLIGAKTNRYKDVQLFKSINNQIAFDLQHMYGIDSIYQKAESSTLGIPLKYKVKYEALVEL